MRTVQVAGSAGKGSVVNLVAAILRTHGVERVGHFIARPHGRWPFPEICEVTGYGSTLRHVASSPYQRVREAGATVAVIEGTDRLADRQAGAGDVTPVIVSLCDDGGRAAVEQAAIEAELCCQLGARIVVGPVPPDCATVIRQVANQRRVTIVWAHEVSAQVIECTQGLPTIAVTTARSRYVARLAVRGRHQLQNATVAIVVAELLDVPAHVITAGLEVAGPLGGRLQYVQRGERTLLVDFIKNARGAELLRDYVAEVHPGGVPIAVRLHNSREAVAEILAPVASSLTFGDAIPEAAFSVIAGPCIEDIVGAPHAA